MIKFNYLKFFVIFVIITLSSNYIFAQNAINTKTDSLDNKRAQNVYAELAGPGLIFSVNYDTRFSNKQDGLGGRIGIGGLSSNGSSIFTIPVQLNYLLGKSNKFFEIGLGFTYMSYSGSNFDIFNDSQINVNKVVGTMNFGYRYQPKEGGFNFRGGISPIFDGNNFIPYYFGVSFGYTF